jgi:hypothetical protein
MAQRAGISRRRFMATAASAGVALAVPPRLHAKGTAADAEATELSPIPPGAIASFPLSAVRLSAGPIREAVALHRRYMAMFPADRLLHTFRLNAGLPSAAEPLGGWEAPDNELRGHFVGHYLTACAQMWAGHDDAAMKAIGEELVRELAKCQQRNGYLSAFPEEHFDRLRDGVRVWAPFYTLHKILQGLLDMHALAGNGQALEMATGMARWVQRFVQPFSEEHMARILDVEYGGMNDALYNLAAVTGAEQWRELAHSFYHERIFHPLEEARDELKGLHVNTQIPKIVGAARRYELTGERRYRDLVEYFWQEVTSRRCYVTGGTSNGEGWGSGPGRLAGELSGYTQECCVTYNMLKVTRHVLSWNADPRMADYYERALYNGILGTQHPRDGHTLYYVPLQSGYWKLFGDPMHSFWCCNGSGMESFAAIASAIYLHDDAGLFVNLFIPSTLQWKERGVRIEQQTRFPEEPSTKLTLRLERPVRFALRLRVPEWARSGGSASLNGKRLEAFAAPSSYFVLDRLWNDGDVVEMTMPMSLRAVPMPDDPSIQAVTYGPLVLAGRMGTAGLTPEILRAEKTKPRTVPEYKGEPLPAPEIAAAHGDLAAAVKRGSHPLELELAGPKGAIALVPLSAVIDERYAVYWKVSAAT